MKENGFTLIEVILVIVIMAIAIPGLISAVSFMTKGQVNTIGTTTAADLAQEEMEAIIAKKRSACGTCGYANTPPTSCAAPLVGAFAQMGAPFSNYWKKTDAECVDSNLSSSGTDQGYKKVTVTVQARGVGPSVPDAVLVTILTNY
ncbi:MAG: type II secretion system protein [Nitrospirae bacterium]|nr:type II secretion system protein [Nitrospirota bacterium]